MEPLLKQMRVRFSGVGQKKTEQSGSVNDQRIPPQKTQSFKEKRKTQNWFQRQFSGQMSQDYDSTDGIEHATAVAAAAFAIKSIEKSAISGKKRTGSEPETSLGKIKSKREEITLSKPEPGGVSKRFSGAGSTKSAHPEDQDGKVPISTATNEKIPEKAILPAPSIKKTPTFDKPMNNTGNIRPGTTAPKTPTFDQQLNNTGSIRPGTTAPKPDLSTTTKPTVPSNESWGQSLTGPGMGKTKADVWEEAEMAKLKERHEKQNATILSWETKKKKKAKQRLDRTESQLDQKRAKAFRKYNSDMEYIRQIAEGARAQAEERHRNEVYKVKEKANTIRRTGKVPTTCCCFYI